MTWEHRYRSRLRAEAWGRGSRRSLCRQPTGMSAFPDAVKGESIKAAIVLNAGAASTSAEIIAWCRERMAVYKAPAAVDFLPQLPKRATGKILKRVLRTSIS